jgi:hypothetical protein
MGAFIGRDETFTTGPAVTEILSTGGTVNGEPGTTVITTFGVPSIADNEAVAVLANLVHNRRETMRPSWRVHHRS